MNWKAILELPNYGNLKSGDFPFVAQSLLSSLLANQSHHKTQLDAAPKWFPVGSRTRKYSFSIRKNPKPYREKPQNELMILRAEYGAKYWKDIFIWETHWPVKDSRRFVRDLGELSHMRPARSQKKSLYSLQSNGRKWKIVWEGSVTSVWKIFTIFLPKPYLEVIE